MTITPELLTESLKAESQRLGFQLSGACPAVEPTGFRHLEDWLDSGCAGEMTYLENRREAYRHPRHVLDGAVSVMMLGMNYKTAVPVAPSTGEGLVSRYAWSNCDYHDLIHDRLRQLIKACRRLCPNVRVRGVVDTAPLLEREFAQLCGIGWQAKNTMLINPQIGSWFFLAALLLDVPLQYDQPFMTSHCGTCTACLDACPTKAFIQPHRLDARRCISYLTIEHREAIPVEFRDKMGAWVFGCDICQEVCPWNNKPVFDGETAFRPDSSRNPLSLTELFFLDDHQFRQRFRKTPLWRPRRRGLLRNAAIALGNQPAQANLAALTHGLNDDEPLIRGAAAWALGRHPSELAETVLSKRRAIEQDPTVLTEIEAALECLANPAS